MTLEEVQYTAVFSGLVTRASISDGICRVRSVTDEELILEATLKSSNLKLMIRKNDNRNNDEFLCTAIEYLLGHNSDITEVNVKGFTSALNADNLLQKYFQVSDETLKISRQQFFQLGSNWYVERDQLVSAESYTETAGRVHPIRKNNQKGLLYSRYVPQIKKTLSFRVIDQKKDLDLFHGWQNQERVAYFWEMDVGVDEIASFINKNLNDPHALPTIAECDGVPVGYFELYWTREDRLAPFYDSEAFDRGFHFLIGNKDFLGFRNTDAILKSLSHFIFLEDRRTRKIMAEPRSDNQKVLRYLETFTAWKKLYEFDFPHKRSALLECKREAFFMENYL